MSEGESARGYTLREAADRLGLSSRQVRRYVLDGRLAAVLVPGPRGREYRVSESAVDELAAERERRGAGREPRRPGSRRELDTLASPETSRLLSDHLSALERAWQRIAELESENATLRAALGAGSSSTGEAAPPAPAPATTRRPRSLRERARRLFGRRSVA
jgi:excisionase family DNA binding protein